MSEVERKAAVDSLKPIRYNGIAMSVLAIATAIMVNYAYDAIAVLVPLMFAVGCIGFASQYRKGVRAVTQAMAEGAIPELRAVAAKKSYGRGWEIGPVSLARSRALDTMLSSGAVATVAFLSETRAVLSVNGRPLGKRVTMVAPLGFGKDLSVHASPTIAPQPSAIVPSPRPSADELPPPPDDWSPTSCPKCGRSVVAGGSFCPKCGFRLKG
jgi:hypothetical protein